MRRYLFVIAAGLFLYASPAFAQQPGDPDAEGCSDSKLLTRMPGCTIVECSAKEFDAVSLQIKPVDPQSGEVPRQELEGAVEQEIAADASALADAITKTGSVAVYGITFDTGRATLQTGSEQVLGEIVKVLNDHTDWRFEVQGHTDNVGAKSANTALSDQRARTVVAWLTSKGIAAPRLVAKGYGDTEPVADNTTEEGRAKNRRVELKKLNEE
jgi:outer membrane protein OmpA-like peptidoglycan-associated protein